MIGKIHRWNDFNSPLGMLTVMAAQLELYQNLVIEVYKQGVRELFYASYDPIAPQGLEYLYPLVMQDAEGKLLFRGGAPKPLIFRLTQTRARSVRNITAFWSETGEETDART